MDVNNADNIAILANTPTKAESLLDSQEQPAGGIVLHVNANKTELMSFKWEGAVSTQNSCPLKFVEKFTYLGSSISSSESDVSMWLTKAWTAMNSLGGARGV